MTAAQIVLLLQAKFGDAILVAEPEGLHPRVHIDSVDWRELAAFLRGEPDLQMDWLANLSGVDYAADGKMCVVYDLWSTIWRHTFSVKVYCDRAAPSVPSVADLWPAADWHEREAFDLLGIVFTDHPDLRRILCADDWVGYPLRKDYEFPRSYQGIPASWEPQTQAVANEPQKNGAAGVS